MTDIMENTQVERLLQGILAGVEETNRELRAFGERLTIVEARQGSERDIAKLELTQLDGRIKRVEDGTSEHGKRLTDLEMKWVRLTVYAGIAAAAGAAAFQVLMKVLT